MAEEKSGGSKIIWIVVSVVVVIAAIIVGLRFVNKTPTAPEEPVQVGSIDKDKIFEQEEFKKIDAQIEEITKSYMIKFEEETKDLDENDEKDLNKILELRRQFQNELAMERLKLIKPAYDRIAAAVANVAIKDQLNVILDKRIVVCGAEDITDKVIAMLDEKSEIEMPDESITEPLSAQSKIGYFDQEVVVSTKDFLDADMELQNKALEMDKQLQKIIQDKNLNENDVQELSIQFGQELQKFRDDLYAPITRKVNRIVEKAARDRKVSLVVDKESIMYGGVNLTNEVMGELTGVGKPKDASTEADSAFPEEETDTP